MGSSESVRVRFAPSPTGYLHVGGARTALFNWLLARKTGGTFVLRIEDTDRERSTQEAVNAILEGLQWLGLSWDEGPYFQSKRIDLYRSYVQKLLEAGRAYRCACSPEQLEAQRKEALAHGRTPRYPGTCRDRKDFPPGAPTAIRFKAPHVGETTFVDLIRGPMRFSNVELDDLILQRADGSPTYNLGVVVDDATMGMTHVIRGDDHLNNTPRQIQIYEALGLTPPRFGHVPLILGADKTRLSKRHGATSVLAYREMGYLPDALVNYLVRLGWSHGDQEIFTREELIEKFSVETVGKSAGVFNPEKLLWLNQHYMKEAPPEALYKLLLPFFRARALSPPEAPPAPLLKLIKALQDRSKLLTEMASLAAFYLQERVEPDPAAASRFLTSKQRPTLEGLRDRLQGLSDWSEPPLKQAFETLLKERSLKMIDLAQPMRVALTGGTVSPGIYEVMEILGRERTLERLGAALSRIPS